MKPDPQKLKYFDIALRINGMFFDPKTVEEIATLYETITELKGN